MKKDVLAKVLKVTNKMVPKYRKQIQDSRKELKNVVAAPWKRKICIGYNRAEKRFLN